MSRPEDAKEDNDEFWDVETNEQVSENGKAHSMETVTKSSHNPLSKSEWFVNFDNYNLKIEIQ